MYDMKPMADSLARQGRYGDSMLVHMNPREVAGLQAYAKNMGGDLTVNPRTGQPEAFLPFLLGMGLQGLGMTALQAGLATGIGTAVATKDIGRGLMAGLGAFGGADVGSGLSAAGATTGTTGSVIPPTTPMAGSAGATLPSGAAVSSTTSIGSAGSAAPNVSLGTQGFGGTALPSGAPVSAFQTPTPGAEALMSFPQAGMPNVATPVVDTTVGTPSFISQTLPKAPAGGFSGMGRGIEALGTEPGRAAFMKSVGGGGGLATDIAFGALSSDALMGSRGAGGMSPSLIRPYDFDPTTRRFTARTPYRAPGPEYKRFQAGGLASQIRTGYRDGNMVRGRGDGMSDEIEATIEGEQDVLLSDGEYVIPADVVAMLGNGSSDAGEQAITNMIKRLRMKKYGRDRQPPEMDDEEMLPA